MIHFNFIKTFRGRQIEVLKVKPEIKAKYSELNKFRKFDFIRPAISRFERSLIVETFSTIQNVHLRDINVQIAANISEWMARRSCVRDTDGRTDEERYIGVLDDEVNKGTIIS